MKINLSSVLSAAANTVLYLATFILIIFAISISIIRFYPNLSEIVESKIEIRLADILNADIEIESLDISRRQLFSEIVVENLQFEHIIVQACLIKIIIFLLSIPHQISF